MDFDRMSHFRSHIVTVTCVFLLTLLPTLTPCGAPLSISGAAKLLPDKVGSLTAVDQARISAHGIFDLVSPEEVEASSNAERMYWDAQGSTFNVHLIQTGSDSGAYALLTRFADGKIDIKTGIVGTASIVDSGTVTFYKGTNVVEILGADKAPSSPDRLLSVARTFATALPDADADIPVLVKHLPNWQATASH